MFPVMLDMAQFPALVVGGTEKAEWKIHVLLESHAQITVASREVSPAIACWALGGALTWLPRGVTEEDFIAHRITFIATADLEEAKKAWTWAKTHHHLINVVDTPDLCEFYTASHFRRDNLVISVSTSGLAPALAKALRVRLQSEFGPEWAESVHEIAMLRKDHNSVSFIKKRAWEVVQSDFRRQKSVVTEELNAEKLRRNRQWTIRNSNRQ